MPSLFKYSGVSTKIKAMKANMFSEEDYFNMSSMRSIPELITFLKGCPAYQDEFKDLDETNVHRGKIEKRIIKSVYCEYFKIYKFVNGNEKKFLEAYFISFEIEIIKMFLRMLYGKGEINYEMSSFEELFQAKSKVDFKKLTSAKNINELIEALRGTDYYRILSILSTSNNVTLFDVEMGLELYYFSKVWKLKEKNLEGENKSLVVQGVGTEVDLLNIIWVYRAKTYYSIEDETIYLYTLPIYYRLKKNQIKKLIDSRNLDEFKEVMDTTYYAKLMKNFYDGNTEEMFFKIISKMHDKAIRLNPMSIAPIRHYMYYKRVEMENIVKITEGIRYSIAPDEIMSYLNISKKKGGVEV